ncbi:hypothetical protein [Calothrix rhizosoleniae]|uniref:hypothetical protein n=1 Tax=Calothrix rhizosoleniae TaxID=888997 RepID=UPI000B4A09E8|nr:hypothetical protein [Calothrix rhizosoleniae]
MKLYNKNCNHPAKQKPSLENKPVKGKELQALTITELDTIAGAGLNLGNHNETVVKFANQPSKQQPSLENKPTKDKELQELTIAELDAIAGAGIGTSPIYEP